MLIITDCDKKEGQHEEGEHGGIEIGAGVTTALSLRCRLEDEQYLCTATAIGTCYCTANVTTHVLWIEYAIVEGRIDTALTIVFSIALISLVQLIEEYLIRVGWSPRVCSDELSRTRIVDDSLEICCKINDYVSNILILAP